MAKKVSDQQCLANYDAMCELFREAVQDSDRFAVVYGYGVDVGMMNFVVVRKTTYTWSSYAIGFDTDANEIVILPISPDLDSRSEPVYLKSSEIKKAKTSWLSKEITIWSKRFPKKYIQFSVQALLDQDPDEVCLCVRQDEQAKQFHDFFKRQYAK